MLLKEASEAERAGDLSGGHCWATQICLDMAMRCKLPQVVAAILVHKGHYLDAVSFVRTNKLVMFPCVYDLLIKTCFFLLVEVGRVAFTWNRCEPGPPRIQRPLVRRNWQTIPNRPKW